MNDVYEGKNTEKFFCKKEDYYDKYRPGYHKEIIEILEEKYGLNNNSIVADYGCGTGKFIDLVSNYVKKAYGIEPNIDMFNKAKEKCRKENITFLNEGAESTSIEDGCVDFAFAVHSFHYFKKDKFLKELQRILKESGYFSIIWYDYIDENNEFSKEWQKLVYEKKNFSDNHNIKEDRTSIFDGLFNQYEFVVQEKYDLEGLLGLGLSISSTPLPRDEDYEEFVEKVDKIFNKYSRNNQVVFDLHCNIQIGKIRR